MTTDAGSECLAESTLLEFVEGRMAPTRLPALEAHLDGCVVCSRLVGKVAAFASAFDLSRSSARDAPHSDAEIALRTVDPSNYVVRREIARGGMGRILEAWDVRHGRPVAIKVLLRGGSAATRRFEREAGLTAKLQHPAIIPLYEAGLWSSGEPFFAMKLVSGRPLDRLIAEAKTRGERLALLPNLIAVTEALAYAHERRVVHRDLKPSNVLVGAFGETVVIDWGLAKRLDESADVAEADSETDSSADERGADGGLTLAGHALGTPSYMPPEQAKGDAVDERADVYALGALLYHLFAGEPPHLGTSPEETLELVLAGPPRPLAVRAPDLPPDLVTLVEKALARDPADRYPSAKEMAEDLRRFAAGELVSSHSYSVRSLLGRWVNRHRAAVSVATLFLVALAVMGGASVRRVVRERDRADALKVVADRERATAEVQRDAAEGLVEFMVVELKTRLETLSRLDVLVGVGAEVEKYYRSVAASNGSADSATLVRRASALETLANVEERKNNDADALSLVTSAIDLRRAALAKAAGDNASERQLATDLLLFGSIALAPGKHEAAMQAFDEARRMAEEHLVREPASTQWSFLLSRSAGKIARVYRMQGDYPRSRELDLMAVEAVEKVVPADTVDTTALNQLAWAYFELGDAEVTLQNARAAGAAREKCLVLRKRMHDLAPDNAAWTRNLGWAQSKIGETAMLTGSYDKAAEAFEATRDMREALARQDPLNTTWVDELAQAHGLLSEALVALGRYDAAIASARRRLEIEQRLAAESPKAVAIKESLLVAHGELGLALLAKGETAASRAEFHEGVVLAAPVADADPTDSRWQHFVAEVGLPEAAAALAAGDTRSARQSHDAVVTALDRCGDDVETALLRARARGLGAEIAVAEGDISAGLAEFEASERAFDAMRAKDGTNIVLPADEAMVVVKHALAVRRHGGPPEEQAELVARALALFDGPPVSGALTAEQAAARKRARGGLHP
jgi:serine/threonine protein kinase